MIGKTAKGSVSLVRIGLSVILAAALLCPASVAAGASFAAISDNFVETFNKGVDLYNSRDLEGALDAFSEAREMNPKDPSVRKNLAVINRSLHRFNEAEAEYQALLALKPDSLDTQLDLGALYLEMGKYTNAQSIYQQVLAKDNKNPQALLGSAIAYEASGDLDSAASLYQDVIAEYPRSTQAKNAESRLARITKAQKAERSSKYFPIDATFGEAGLGWWNLKQMPLHVYIDSGDGVKGYRPEMRELVSRAMANWSSASEDNINFVIDSYDGNSESAWKEIDDTKPVLLRIQENLAAMPRDPVPAQIHIHWTNNLYRALGLTWTSRLKDNNPVLSKVHIWITTDRLADGSVLPARSSSAYEAMFDEQLRMLEEVVTHEFGHALGLPHLSNPNDLMAAGIYGFNARDLQEQRQLSSRDIQALSEHYNGYQGSGINLASQSALMDEEAKSEKSDATEKTDKEEPTPVGGGNPFAGLGRPDDPSTPKDEPKSESDTGTDTEKAKAEPESKEGADKAKEGDEAKGEEKAKAEEEKPKTEEEKAKAEEEKAKADEEKAKKEEEEKAKEEEEAKTKGTATKPKSQTKEGEEGEEEKEEEEPAHVTINSAPRTGAPGGKSQKGNDPHPLKDALFYLQSRRYHDCLHALNHLLSKETGNAQAHYLRGVCYVMMRDYHHAANDYKEVIKLSPGSDLAKRAEAGLKKINF